MRYLRSDGPRYLPRVALASTSSRPFCPSVHRLRMYFQESSCTQMIPSISDRDPRKRWQGYVQAQRERTRSLVGWSCSHWRNNNQHVVLKRKRVNLPFVVGIRAFTIFFMIDGFQELLVNVADCIRLSTLVPLLHDTLLVPHWNDIESNIYLVTHQTLGTRTPSIPFSEITLSTLLREHIRKIELNNSHSIDITRPILPGHLSEKHHLQRCRVR